MYCMILMKTYLLWSTLFICEWLVEKYTSLISVSMYHFMHKRYTCIYHWIACVSPEYSLQKYAGINISFILICLESGLYRNHGSVWSLGPKRRPVLKSLYRAYDNRTVYAAYLRLLYSLIQHFLLFTEVNGALDNIFRHFFPINT